MKISKEEKSEILDMHNVYKRKLNEQKLIFDDPSNIKAINSWLGDRERKKYTFDIKEPFVFETTNEAENNMLKFILNKAKVDFEYKSEKID